MFIGVLDMMHAREMNAKLFSEEQCNCTVRFCLFARFESRGGCLLAGEEDSAESPLLPSSSAATRQRNSEAVQTRSADKLVVCLASAREAGELVFWQRQPFRPGSVPTAYCRAEGAALERVC